MKRPPIIVLLCIFLLWDLASGISLGRTIVPRLWSAQAPRGHWPVLIVLALCAAPLAAPVAAMALWRMRSWATAAFGAWAVLLVVQMSMLFRIVGGVAGLRGASWIPVLLVLGGIAFGLLVAGIYVRRATTCTSTGVDARPFQA